MNILYKNEDDFLGVVHSVSSKEAPWTITLTLKTIEVWNSKFIQWQTSLSLQKKSIMQYDGPLQPTDHVLSGPMQHALMYKDNLRELQSALIETQQSIYVIKGLCKTLL